ncbi:MAG TPA: tRNA lysidine(34) synthetase TilS [Acidisarcina sp.]
MTRTTSKLPLALEMFRPGMRAGVAVSGGADSVALLRTLLLEQGRMGLVLSVVHVHHGIRGAEADGDAGFVEELARSYSLPFHLERVNVPTAAGAAGETIEEAARNLRYRCFGGLIERDLVDVVLTAHTLDDQAETVLHRLLRGAWTEGLGGIYPSLSRDSLALKAAGGLPSAKSGREESQAAILRPFLAVRRVEIEGWLRSIGQAWREDSTNQDQAHTRNRLRRSLLPELLTYNPQIATQLAHLALLARDEEQYWETELARLMPSLLLPGRATRGGGRSTQSGESSVAIELERLRPLAPALRRRVLRAAAREIGVKVDFAQTEQLMELCQAASSGGKGKGTEVGAGICVVRTPREIRLVKRAFATGTAGPAAEGSTAEYVLAVPGEVFAERFGVVLTAEVKPAAGRLVDEVLPRDNANPAGGAVPGPRVRPEGSPGTLPDALVRGSRPGDVVRLRYSRGARRVKEVFERLQVPAGERPDWPVVEWAGKIIWMRGAEIESEAAEAAGLIIRASSPDTP